MLDQVKTIQIYDYSIGKKITKFLLPLFDKDGDQVNIFATQTREGYVLDDDGWHLGILLSDREMVSKREQVIKQFCEDHGMWIKGYEICRKSDGTNLVKDAYQFGLDLIELVEVIRE